MNKLGGVGLFIAAIFLVLTGLLIQSPILEWLLNLVGWVIVIAGVILGVYGLVKMFSGDKGGSSDI